MLSVLLINRSLGNSCFLPYSLARVVGCVRFWTDRRTPPEHETSTGQAAQLGSDHSPAVIARVLEVFRVGKLCGWG